MISVLYLDDEDTFLEIGKLYLESMGPFSVDAVRTPSDALTRLGTTPYDAIICDYQMPGTDGIAFLKMVRARFGDIPFILFTGKAREEVILQAIRNGADFYTQKGGDAEAQFTELGHKIKAAVGRRQAAAALKNSENRLAEIIDFLPDPMFAIDNSGTVISWNRAMADLTGVPASGMVGKADYEYAVPIYGSRRKTLIDLVSAGDDAIREAQYALMRREGPVLVAESVSAKPRGVPRTFLCRASPLCNESGEIAGAIETLRDITEKKETERTLEENREYLAKILDSVRAGILVIDAKTHGILDVNPAASELIGLPRKEIVGNVCHRFICPSESGRCPVTDLGQAVDDSERVLVNAGGEPVPIIKYAVRTPVNGKDCILETFVRNTRQVAAGEENRGMCGEHPAPDLPARALDRVPVPVFWLGDGGEILYANDAASAHTGYSRKDLAGLNFYQVYQNAPPSLRDAVSGGIRGTSGIFSQNLRLCSRDSRCSDVRMTAIPAADGTPQSCIVYFTDSSREDDLHRTLAECNEKLRFLMDYGFEGILMVDAKGSILFANDALLHLVEEPGPGPVIGRQVMEYLSPESRETASGDLAKVIAGGEGFVTEYDGITKTGRKFRIECIGKGMIHEEKAAVLLSIHDITPHKQMEEALLAANRKLKLLSSVTRHDINNKVTTLLGYLLLAKQVPHDEKITPFLDKIEGLANAIGDHIRFTKIYQALGTSEPRWQELSRLIRDTPSPPEIAVTADVNGFSIRADPILEKVFSNLLDNTLRHGEHATAVHVSATETADGLVIAWEDDGVGVRPGEKEKIFGQGYGKNTGLGLFLTREILAITGMTIRETGEPGRGARFEIHVPKGEYRREGKGA